jgi:hypothetical protein
MPERERPHPWVPLARSVHLEDATDNRAIGERVVIVVAPLG